MPARTEGGRKPGRGDTFKDSDIKIPLTVNHFGPVHPDPSVVRAELNRLLASEGLRYSERLARFLKYVVEQELAGNGGQLKESVLAIEIFDRDPTYNSRVDSVVRVEARRLRQKLDRFYAVEGRDNPVVISLPKGSYAPVFSFRAETELGAGAAPAQAAEAPVGGPVRRPRQLPLKFAVAAALVCAAAAILLTRWVASHGAGPSAPLRRLTSDAGLTFQPTLSPDGRLVAYSSDRSGQGDLDIWVQQVSGGRPVRLTDSPGDDVEPVFSPDGTTIAYRADGEIDGIFFVPALGGNRTLLVRGGFRPRFSPDGSRVAYWSGERTFRAAKILIVPSGGGTPVQFQPEFRYAGYPVWSPDGRYLAFVGSNTAVREESNTDDWDWWVAPVGGGPAVRSFARVMLAGQGLLAPETGRSHHRIAPDCWTASNQIVFSARSGDRTNIWSVPIAANRRVRGPAKQITFGAGREDHPAVGADDTLAFSVLTYRSDVWALPIHVETAEPAGPILRVASAEGNYERPVVSRDGSRLAFTSTRSGNNDVWVKDLKTGIEKGLTSTRQDETSPILSPDGARVAYGYAPPLREPILVVPFGGGRPVQLCADCGEPRAWLPNGAGVLYQKLSPKGESLIGVLGLSGQNTPLVRSSSSALFSPSVSPDGRWLALVVRTPPNDHRVTVVPLRNGAAAPESEWISVTEAGPWVNKPRWSPSGNLLYYTSDRDGFVCIWANRLDPATKKPAGPPKAVIHFHSGHSSLDSVYGLELSVAEDKLVFNLGESSGNVWLAPAH